MFRTARPTRAASPIRALLLPLLLTLGPAGVAVAQTNFVMGQVLAEDGAPVAGAVVVATRAESGSERFDTRTDKSGRFAIIGMRPGIWDFRVSAPGFDPGGMPVRMAASRVHTPFEVRLRRTIEVPIVLGDLDAEALQVELAQARALLVAGRADEAIAAYRAVQSRVPALTSVQVQIAQAYRQKGDYEAAIAAYRAALANTSSERARLDLALTEIERGNIDAGLAELRAATTAPGASKDAFYALGEAHARAGNTGEATAAFEHASRLDRTWVRPYLRLAEMAAARGEPAVAREYFERVIALAPASPEAAQARARLGTLP